MDRIRMNEMLAKLSLSDPIPIDQFGGKGKQKQPAGSKAGRGGAMGKQRNYQRLKLPWRLGNLGRALFLLHCTASWP